jgi:transcriptional regulator with XRE-family HTH domain
MEDKIKENISFNLRAIRKQKKLSQTVFADQIGITRPALGAYEEGRSNPPLAVLVVISNLSGFDIHTLVTEKIEKEVSNV